MAKNTVSHLNTGETYMMFYAVLIVQSGYYPVFLIKPNQNIVAAVGLYLLKAFN